MFKLEETALSVKGKPIELYKNIGSNSNNVLFIGGFHGDEPQGVIALKKFLTLNISSKNNIFVIPCLNPDGLDLSTRVNANKVDINRNFPTTNWELSTSKDYFGGQAPASEPETKFVAQIINRITPKLILSLHSPYKVVNYDGPAKDFCPKIAEIMNYPIETDIGYPTPGSFGTYCGIEKNIPTITLELGEDESAEWQYDHLAKVFDYLSNI